MTEKEHRLSQLEENGPDPRNSMGSPCCNEMSVNEQLAALFQAANLASRVHLSLNPDGTEEEKLSMEARLVRHALEEAGHRLHHAIARLREMKSAW